MVFEGNWKGDKREGEGVFKNAIVNVEYNTAVVLNDIVNMMRSRIEDKGVEFIVKIDPGLPLVLNGDEIRIKQIIMNILSNAAKYTEKGSVTGISPAVSSGIFPRWAKRPGIFSRSDTVSSPASEPAGGTSVPNPPTYRSDG